VDHGSCSGRRCDAFRSSTIRSARLSASREPRCSPSPSALDRRHPYGLLGVDRRRVAACLVHQRGLPHRTQHVQRVGTDGPVRAQPHGQARAQQPGRRRDTAAELQVRHRTVRDRRARAGRRRNLGVGRIDGVRGQQIGASWAPTSPHRTPETSTAAYLHLAGLTPSVAAASGASPTPRSLSPHSCRDSISAATATATNAG
jgi:hypothetical protein